MRHLVALDLPGGPEFIEATRRCLAAGEAIAPLDQRLHGTARDRLLRVIAPTHLIDANGERHTLAEGRTVEEGDLVVVATSGTTGEPKGVILTDDAVRASALATSSALQVNAATDHWLGALPLNHVGGLSIVLRAILTDTPLTLQPNFDHRAYVRALEEGATLTSLVPTTLARLGEEHSERFRRILLGGSAMPPDLPENVVTTYGMTETGSGVIYNGLPLEGVELRFSASGEIELRCPMLLRCYRDGSDPRTADGFFRTGDIGRTNECGRLEVFGREGELIITGGENVWPVAVEQLLAESAGVHELAVVGLPDPDWGERVVAIVVTTDGGPPNLGQMNELLRDAIGPWAQLRGYRTVASLPRTAIGKLNRRALRELAGDPEHPLETN